MIKMKNTTRMIVWLQYLFGPSGKDSDPTSRPINEPINPSQWNPPQKGTEDYEHVKALSRPRVTFDDSISVWTRRDDRCLYAQRTKPRYKTQDHIVMSPTSDGLASLIANHFRPVGKIVNYETLAAGRQPLGNEDFSGLTGKLDRYRSQI